MKRRAEELRLVLAACESRGAECEQVVDAFRIGDASRRLGTKRADGLPLRRDVVGGGGYAR